MSYTKEGYKHMAAEILNDFITIGLFIDPQSDQHYTSKTIIFKSKIASEISTEVSIVILKNLIDPSRYKTAAIDIIDTMLEHTMFQQWTYDNPEVVPATIEYLQFYIESKCQSAMRAKNLYEKAKRLMGEDDENDGKNETLVG